LYKQIKAVVKVITMENRYRLSTVFHP